MRFIYVMDPMCAWCYAFQPELERFLSQHKNIDVEWVMGGLAPDTSEPMADELKQTIASYWHQIESRSQASFNHEYWQLNTPYRATYQACRAVIAAEQLKAGTSERMVKEIQSAYYQQAKNPSLDVTLQTCARKIGLDDKVFTDALNSPQTEQRLQQHLGLTQHLRVGGFPALFYIDDESRAHAMTLGFCETANLVQRFNQVQAQVGS